MTVRRDCESNHAAVSECEHYNASTYYWRRCIHNAATIHLSHRHSHKFQYALYCYSTMFSITAMCHATRTFTCTKDSILSYTPINRVVQLQKNEFQRWGFSEISLLTHRDNNSNSSSSTHPFYGHCVSQHLELRPGGLCQSKILLPSCPCWRHPTSTFGLARRCWSSPQQCCLHCLHTVSPHRK